MLPPILEIYAVWHPGDPAGRVAAEQLSQHFHGALYSGLVGGAVEVYIRSEGWRAANDAPRPIPLPGEPPPNGVTQAQITVIVPVLGNEFAAAVQTGEGAWHDYASRIVIAQAASPDRVGVFPLLVDRDAADGTELGRIFSRFQRIAVPAPGSPPEPEHELRCRDLAQGIAQLTAGPHNGRLVVFISHTKRAAFGEEADIQELIARVRSVISQTRLSDFFDANDLQPGRDWDQTLRSGAATSALLAIRTDLYASREWCQREMLIAKREGMPIVILDALGRGEERGSFLMDHVPRVPVRHDGDRWRDADIRLGLNLLVDECLKRALWRRQEELARNRPELDIVWWAPHAPEPITFSEWLERERASGRLRDQGSLRILHPDPPLGPDERSVLEQIAALVGVAGRLDIMTPRLLAARGG
jgi:hypothetical protein